MKKILQRKAKVLLKKTIPLWIVVLLIAESTFGAGLIEYFILRRNFNNEITKLAQTTKNPEELIQILKQKVLPANGYVLGVTWKDIGIELLNSGVIDKQKFEQTFGGEADSLAMMKYLTSSSNDHMYISEKNEHFMVNTLWGLGLINKSNILEEGQMKTEGSADPMNYASTAGWNLGSEPTSQLYSSKALIQLTPKQEEIVKTIASNIYRPCCSNSVAFPDCNHGMAALGYIELAVKQGLSEKRIYRDILALNSYWFPQQYVNLAAYFNGQKTDWKNIDPKTVLRIEYSSGQGAAQIAQAVQNVPGLQSKGGCGA